MIDKKNLKEAARKYMNELYQDEDFPVKIHEIKEQWISDFEEGAMWAINEFPRDLWHNASEEPEKDKWIIERIFDEDGYNYEVGFFIPHNRTWVQHVKRYDVVGWCYLDDILPEEGGEIFKPTKCDMWNK